MPRHSLLLPKMKSARQILSKLRLYSGLALMFYLFTHLINTALGMISLEAMEAGLALAQVLWNPGGIGWVVASAAIIHVGIVFWQIFQQERLSFKGGDLLRMILGLTIPYAIVAHYIGSHIVPVNLGFRPDYASSVYSMFNLTLTPVMLLLVAIAWLHGCMGLHYWLRYKSWYGRFKRLGIGPAIALPVLAIAGFISSGKEVLRRAEDPQIQANYLLHKGAKTKAEMDAHSNEIGNQAGVAYSSLLIFLFAGRALRLWLRKRKHTIRITYPDGTEVLVHPGTSILSASQLAGIPHASVCGGRGRCSTCRIRVVQGLENLPAPAADESRVLQRVGLAPNVRLACCATPHGAVQIYPLLTAHKASINDGLAKERFASGKELDLAIMFADLRGFTRFSEHKLPYDVVFVLNQYFELMGQAIEAAGGHVDKFIGDGIMALFGMDGDLSRACRGALQAARLMEASLAELNRRLEHDLPEPLDMGIAIHCGHVIAGRMGYGSTVGLTAIGDPVNTASRLESATRDLGCRLLISEEVRAGAGLNLAGMQKHQINLRGRSMPLEVYAIQTISSLSLPL